MWSLWVLAACSGEEAAGSEFKLHLDPVLATNQPRLFDEVSQLDLVVQHSDGSIDEPRDFGTPASGGVLNESGFEPMENVVLRLEGYEGEGLHAWGRTAPLTLDEGEQTASVFMGAVGEIAWLDRLDIDLFGPEVVALGNGRFLATAGMTKDSGLSAELSEVTAILDLLSPAENLAFGVIDAPLPLYAELGVGEEVTRGRLGATLTALDDGRVLLTGGGRTYPIAAGSSASRDLEIWDPDTAQWSADERLAYPRSGHIAIKNALGRVLFWGGVATEYEDDEHMSPATAFTPMYLEYFDPEQDATEKVQIPDELGAGSLGVGAANFGGQDGTLICGGIEFVRIDADADGSEDDDVWRSTARCIRVETSGNDYLPDDDMALSLAGHAMVTLADGRLLLTGGANQDDPMVIGRYIDDYHGEVDALPNAWTYNPSASASERWSTALPEAMNYPRAGHQMHLLPDGRVLIVGGSSTWNNSLMPEGEPVRCAEIFDPNENSFTVVNGCSDESTTGLEEGAARLSVAADPDYGLLIAGGVTADQSWASNVGLYLVRP